MKEHTFGYLCSLLLALPPCLRMVKFIPEIPIGIYYGIFICIGLLEYIKYGFRYVNKATLLFLLFCAISLLLNDTPKYFNAWERFVGLVSIIVSVGPLFSDKLAVEIKLKCFKYVMWICVGINVLSFVLYLISPGLTITERGHLYGGITTHSMTMSPVAAISTLFLVYYLCLNISRLSKPEILGISTAIITCILNCVLAGSRSALLSLFVALVVWLWFYFRHNRKFFFYTIFGIILLSAVSSPIWWKYTETIQNKIAYSENRNSFSATRDKKWNQLLTEIEEKPLTGCGFGTTKYSKHAEGRVEPGNGWLFVWSSCGLFAFIMFILVFYSNLKNLLKNSDLLSLFIASLLIFFALHINAEGYSISSGAPLCFLMWLALGTGYSLRTQN